MSRSVLRSGSEIRLGFLNKSFLLAPFQKIEGGILWFQGRTCWNVKGGGGGGKGAKILSRLNYDYVTEMAQKPFVFPKENTTIFGRFLEFSQNIKKIISNAMF